MIPDLDMVASAALQSMRESVTPAIDPTDKIAMENSALVVNALEEIQALAQGMYETALHELAAEVALLDRVQVGRDASGSSGDEPAVITEARRIARLDIPSFEQIVEIRRALREHTDRLVRDALTKPPGSSRKAVTDAVLDFAAREEQLPQFFKLRF